MSTRMSIRLAALAALAFPPPAAQAANLVVDAAGSPGSYPTVNAAMAAAVPGDRLLVQPGTYPAFQFSKGVSVLGMGPTAADVVVARVDFHPTTPLTGFDATLSNMTIGTSAAIGALGITGNEVPPGALLMHGLHVHGGIFLGGGDAGLYIQLADSLVEASTGQGFGGAAVWLGGSGNYVQLDGTLIEAWDADPASGIAAGNALLLRTGTQARLDHVILRAGDGSATAPGFVQGGSGLVQGGLPGTVTVRLDGASEIRGGDGGQGGAGVAVTGTIDLGDALVLGGNGATPGVAYALAQPTPLATDLRLATQPDLAFASGSNVVVSGQSLHYGVAPGPTPRGIALSFDLEVPWDDHFVPLDPAGLLLVVGHDLVLDVPTLPAEVTGLLVHVQGLVVQDGHLLSTNASSLRIDLSGGGG